MPKSFLIKRAQKVNTGFFPWRQETLVPGCCLEYEMNEKENECKEEKDEIEVCRIEDNKKEDSHRRSNSPSALEIRVLTPYDAPLSPPRLIVSTCCDDDHDHHKNSSSDDDVIIPSPLGYQSLEGRRSPYQSLGYHSHHYHQQHQQYNHYLTATRNSSKSYYDSTPSMKYPPQSAATSPWSQPMASMEDLKRHQCEYCLKWFQRSSSLSNHRLIHKNSKTFKCNQCNMSFLRKSDLGKHMVTHSGSKPYQCNVCGKRFSQSSNMLTHQRRHTGVRPYSCGVCGKSFYRKVDVRRHASVHRDF